MALGTGLELISIQLVTTGANANVWSIGFNAVDYLYFVEDIYSFSITGKICFRDHIGITEFGPLNGTERFVLQFGNVANDKDYKTLVLNVQEIERIERDQEHRASSASKVTLLLVDQYYRNFYERYWSKSWVDTKISDIITDICKNHVGIEDFVQFEPTNEKIEFFDTHNRNPAECINWLMNRASGTTTKQPGYMMYHANNPDTETFGYNFVTLEKLLQQKEWMKPYEEIGNASSGNAVYYFENDNPDYINKIKDHEIFSVDLNSLKALSNGIIIGYDARRKKLLKKEYTYQEAVKRYTILGSKTLFPKEANLDHPMTFNEGYSDEALFDNIWFGKWIKEYTVQQQVHITVDGHPLRKAGGMIRVVWESHDEYSGSPYGNQEIFNKQMDGKYMIKSITNYFNPKLSYGWQQKLVCVKNGYTDSPNPNLIDAVKRNVT